MRELAEVKPPSQVNPKLLHRLFFVEHALMLAATILALINLFPEILGPFEEKLTANWVGMRPPCLGITLCAVLSLFFSEGTQSLRTKRAGVAFGGITLSIAVVWFMLSVPYRISVPVRFSPWYPTSLRQGSLEFSSVAFLLLAVAILLHSLRGRWTGKFADGAALLLFFAVFSMISKSLLSLAGVPGPSTAELISTPSLCCLALLMPVVVFRRTEEGYLSILWGFGSGSRIARMLAPILLVLPLLREMARVHLIRTNMLPASDVAALLTSIAVLAGLLLIFLLARFVNRTQERVQEASLRDELTGLHSARGFYLLAEQAFRHSRRAHKPFTVLFIDMDNLKKINDQLGHSVGSTALVEAAKLLTGNFRYADIIGRVGGDEFVVAGQFSTNTMAVVTERLREAVARKNKALGKRFSISLSMGYAVAESSSRETLQNLIARADEAMYREKRSKKNNPTTLADLEQRVQPQIV